MLCYSIESRKQIFLKGNGFLSFAKTFGKNNYKNISKNVNNVLQMHLKLLQKSSSKQQK